MSPTPPVVILCGGRGTRLQERTHAIPKPMVEIGPHPILWHVIQLYSTQGFGEFVLCTGYKGEQIEEFVREADWPAGIDVRCVDTGVDTQTGGRVARVRDVIGERRFCATYSDGVADIDLRASLAFHEAHGVAATMTVVRPELQFGVARLGEEDRVLGFQEKPRADQWINGGFFVFEPAVFGYLADDSVLEREPLEGLAGDGQLRAYRHAGFWDCMDTYKDAVMLNDLWAAGDAPWKTWDDGGAA
ncbi:MAG: nucleotidyl transferase [Solirubrobacterales bacterium]|jgi:glucose-1-phosphate cytidylyltransferase|nr:nucleotidyl transferase [Solirubrobacterales bacterium]